MGERVDFTEVKDSGKRTEFESGAVRDRAEGKGRYDLMSWHALHETASALRLMIDDPTDIMSLSDGACLALALRYGLSALGRDADRARVVAKAAACVHRFVHRQECRLHKVPRMVGHYDVTEERDVFGVLSPFAMHRLARHFENGARKYDDRNWEKGIPLSRFLDSGIRHLFKLMLGVTDEDHAAASEWNFHCFIHTLHEIEAGRLPEGLYDIPRPDKK
jgi:hypothetical protein